MKPSPFKRIIGVATTLIVVLLVAAVVIPMVFPAESSERYFSGDAEVYYEGLIEKGFPTDYAVALTELHLLHPSWEFTPLLITEAEPQYTWKYVIDKETEKGETNVVYADSDYAAYHHPLNREKYDSGYYQASRSTVEYFMDPRNFLNETDIFQFYTLSGGDGKSIDSVNAILKGTFMENATLENGKSYASYFMTIGQELGIDPVFLAAKVRQEQGSTGISPLISGSCGTKMWEFYRDQTDKTESGQSVNPPSSGHNKTDLLALDGYYNYFNVGATGKGVFNIYYNAMQYAQKGTEAMRDAWGGSPAWNTRWKALYGGAYFLKTSYIDCYQSTVYLQKFNVDSRAKTNFTKQYMTAVFGAMSEGRALYQSFAALDALDAPASFLIPVYGNMPTSPSADPANGRVKNLAQATNRYDYRADLTEPQQWTAKNGAVYTTEDVYPASTLKLNGSLSHDYEIEGLEYAWDGGEWQTAGEGERMNLSLFIHFPENTSHILTVRGKASYSVTRSGSSQTIHSYVLYAVIYVNVLPQTGVTLTYEVGNSVTKRELYAGSTVTLPECDAADFAGWYGSDGSFLPSGADLVIESDLSFFAVFLELQELSGASLDLSDDSPALCFSAVLNKKSYNQLTAHGTDTLLLTATLSDGEVDTVTDNLQTNEITANGKEWVCLTLSTPPISIDDLDTSYRATFYAALQYTNGERTTLTSALSKDARTAKEVAQAALADTNASYSVEMIARLREILGNE